MTLNRIFVICLAIIGSSWGLAYLADLQQRAETPWYAWLILALGLAVVVALSALLWHLPTK